MQFNPFMTGMLVSVAIASISQVLLKKAHLSIISQ